MSGISSIASNAADLLAAIRQQLLAKTSTSGDAQKTSPSGGGLDAMISEIESSSANAAGSAAGTSSPTTGSGASGLSSGVLGVLIVFQEQGVSGNNAAAHGASGNSGGGQLFAALDSNGDGQISKSELESAFTAGAGTAGLTTDQATQAADAVIGKLDTNGDGSVSQGELAAAAPKGHHHHHHGGSPGGAGGADPLAALLAPASASASGSASEAGTSSAVTNADGSTTTTVTYADGTKITLSTPVGANASSSPNAAATGDGATAGSAQSPSEKLLAALIRLQEQAFQSQPIGVASLAA